MTLGEKLKEARLARGLSLHDLAARTGLTASFLSLLERDLSNPSLTSLRDVCRALDLPLFELFADETRRRAVVRKEQRQLVTFADNPGAEFQRLSPGDRQAKLELILLVLQPEAASHPERFSHRGEEAALCLQGEVQVLVGDEEYDLRPGDCVYLDSTLPHRYVNTGRERAEVLLAVTPPSF